LYEQAESLIRRGKAYAAVGSEVYPYVRELLDNQGFAEATRITSEGTFTFGGRMINETTTGIKALQLAKPTVYVSESIARDLGLDLDLQLLLKDQNL